MLFFGLRFFMESSPHWAIILTLKQFKDLSASFRVITQFNIYPHWLGARKYFYLVPLIAVPPTGSVLRNHPPKKSEISPNLAQCWEIIPPNGAQYGEIIPLHWLSTGKFSTLFMFKNNPETLFFKMKLKLIRQ